MLGKTAGGLFWMFRYLERSENTARLIEAGLRIALTRSGSTEEEWASVLQTVAVYDGFIAKYGTDITRDQAIDWMLRDPQNPSSVMTVIEAARNNAKTVRTALTREVWEAVNECWMSLKQALTRKVADQDLPFILQLIRQRSAYVRGALHGTMLRNDIYNFARIGTFCERADNTARILDVKYYVLLPSAMSVGTNLDNVQWQTILQSVSAEGGFQMAYGQDPRPREIAQFLILDRRMPRSLAFCTEKIRSNLGYLMSDYGTRLPCHDIADAMALRSMQRDIDSVLDSGLHEFIQDFIQDNANLSMQVQTDYRFNQ
ncbi:A alpha-helical domain with a conserved ER moti [Marivivens niveibacter]|uniref:A alpha-helical domain with a conserved ER moti n=1 Tax=Marivivens niveibacter TaxID=1930667 RepID=A0A251WZV4_9RHOB|nr:alpha-E domain-containing protein [Marivivens niveibacter]OUD09594.1 A alpha-helical domain with a conserved ER moti [Marivivens niveibacter]